MLAVAKKMNDKERKSFGKLLEKAMREFLRHGEVSEATEIKLFDVLQGSGRYTTEEMEEVWDTIMKC